MDPFHPLQSLADWLTYTVFGLAKTSKLGASVDFFLYDVPKVLLLLAVVVFAVAVIRSFFPPEKTRAYLSHSRLYAGNVAAALLGIVTPFCSCSAVPLFIGFVESGVPLGVTFSFLVASPMINEVAVILLFGLFGWKIAGLYVVSGLVIAITSGIIIGKLGLETWVEEYVYKIRVGEAGELPEQTWRERGAYATGYVKEIVGKVWPYVVVGIAIGAVMHGYVPNDFLVRYAGPGNPFAVPLAVLIGVPLYSNAAGVIPLVSVLTEKGMAMGTVLAFMMAVVGLSLPEAIILRKVLKPKLIAVYFGINTVGIIAVGYLFNAVLHWGGTMSDGAISVRIINAEACGWGGANLYSGGPLELLGFDEGSTWAMPIEWRLHVLEERLNGAVAGSCEIESVDLDDVPTAERDAALDALLDVRGDFPVVFVDGVVACVGDIDVDAIATAVAARRVDAC